MCGIAGFTHKHWSPPEGRIREAVDTLKHRGPDQQGVFSSELFSFGAARLKIIDLETGNQPILENAGEWGIVFNGEIYNHLEIRAELERLGHRFTSHSDTETVLKAFLQWDKESFKRLRGMFAVAIWDLPAKRFVLARDRMGIKPLYYVRKRRRSFLRLGTQVHPDSSGNRAQSEPGRPGLLSLAELHPLTLDVDRRREGKFLRANGWNGRTGISPPEVTGNCRLTARRIFPRKMLRASSTGCLQESIREHLLSDVPLGVWLSGGVDSTTILHYAARASSSQLKTFSISFLGRSFDETRYVREAVKHYGTDHDEMDLNPEVDLQSAIEEFAYYSDEPSADAGALPVWFLSKLCKTKDTVALSGEGADELFGGYLTYRANRMARLDPRDSRSGDAGACGLTSLACFG